MNKYLMMGALTVLGFSTNILAGETNTDANKGNPAGVYVGDLFDTKNPDVPEASSSVRRNLIQIHQDGTLLFYQTLITDFTSSGNGGVESVAMGIWERNGANHLRAVLFEAFAPLIGENNFGPWTESDRVTFEMDLTGKVPGQIVNPTAPVDLQYRKDCAAAGEATVYNNNYKAYTNDSDISLGGLRLLDPDDGGDAASNITGRAFCVTKAKILDAYFSKLPN